MEYRREISENHLFHVTQCQAGDLESGRVLQEGLAGVRTRAQASARARVTGVRGLGGHTRWGEGPKVPLSIFHRNQG